jgi:hypothetical protein
MTNACPTNSVLVPPAARDLFRHQGCIVPIFEAVVQFGGIVTWGRGHRAIDGLGKLGQGADAINSLP